MIARGGGGWRVKEKNHVWRGTKGTRSKILSEHKKLKKIKKLLKKMKTMIKIFQFFVKFFKKEFQQSFKDFSNKIQILMILLLNAAWLRKCTAH